MSTLLTTTTYMTFREDSSTSSASSCEDVGCKNPGNDRCSHPGCVAANNLLVGQNQGYSGFHGFLGRRLPYDRKKKLSFSLCYAAAFLTGTEYAIILPTVWRYLQQLGQDDERYVGYVTAAFSVGSILSHLVIGRIADQTRDSRRIILLVNLFQIVGQLLYAIGINAFTLVLARFLSGIGVGLNSALFAEVVRGTNRRERPWYIVGSFMTRQLSIFMAPVYNSFVRHLPVVRIPFRNGYTLELHEGSYPGLVMAALWTAFELAVACFYFNMTAERKAERHRRRQKQAYMDVVKRNAAHCDTPACCAKSPLRVASSTALSVARSPSSAKLSPTAIQPSFVPATENTPESQVRGQPPHRKDGFLETVAAERRPLLLDSGCHGSSSEFFGGGRDDVEADGDDDDLGSSDDEERPSGAAASGDMLGLVSSGRRMGDGFGSAGNNSRERSGSRGRHRSESLNLLGFKESAPSEPYAVMSVESIGHVNSAVYRAEFLSRHAIPLLFMQFTVLMCQTMVETAIPPILQCYFKYGSKENSFVFMGIGAEELIVHAVLLMFSGVVKPSKRIPPRNLLVASCVFMAAGLIGLMVTSRNIEYGYDGRFHHCPSTPEGEAYFAHFAECCALLFLGIPVGAVMSVSLLSQLLDYKVQGMGQGLGRFCCSVGMILGPLWGGSSVYKPELLYGGAITVVTVEFVLLLISFPALKLPD